MAFMMMTGASNNYLIQILDKNVESLSRGTLLKDKGSVSCQSILTLQSEDVQL